MGRCVREASENFRVDRAADKAMQIMAIDNVPKGEKRQFGDYIAIKWGDSEDPTNTSSVLEIDYKGARVLTCVYGHSHGYGTGGDCTFVISRKMSPDFSWIKDLNYQYQVSLQLYQAEKAEKRHLPNWNRLPPQPCTCQSAGPV